MQEKLWKVKKLQYEDRVHRRHLMTMETVIVEAENRLQAIGIACGKHALAGGDKYTASRVVALDDRVNG